MASSRTFPVDVPDVGHFVFRRRRLIEQIKIEAEVEKILNGEGASKELENALFAYLTLQVLTVTAPVGWDLEEIDPLDAEHTGRMWKVWGALRDKEAAFRQGVGGDGVAEGAGAR